MRNLLNSIANLYGLDRTTISWCLFEPTVGLISPCVGHPWDFLFDHASICGVCDFVIL